MLRWALVGIFLDVIGCLLLIIGASLDVSSTPPTRGSLMVAAPVLGMAVFLLLLTGVLIEFWIFVLSVRALWRPPWKRRWAAILALALSFLFGGVPVALFLFSVGMALAGLV